MVLLNLVAEKGRMQAWRIAKKCFMGQAFKVVLVTSAHILMARTNNVVVPNCKGDQEMQSFQVVRRKRKMFW
jgi:hypothetical protein